MKKYLFGLSVFRGKTERNMEIIINAENCGCAFEDMKSVLKQEFGEDFSFHTRFVYSEKLEENEKQKEQ